jgi:uncharacterized protein
MDYVVICLVSLLVAALTLFSGFGLGTLLLPAFSFFFPIEIAVAATAVVHLANNLFKLAFVGKMADWRVTAKFTGPALVTSALGAMLLLRLGQVPSIAEYALFGKSFRIELIKLTIGITIGFFALFDLLPGLSKLNVSSRYIPLGGALSGFFGGLSGMQGALRSMFLIRAGLTKEQFIGTGVVAAVIVDLSRIAVYGSALISGQLAKLREAGILGLVIAGTGAALLGTIAGTQLVKKVTLETVQKIVGILLLMVAVGLCAGWI